MKKDYVKVEEGITTITLKHPIKLKKDEITKIKMDFNSLTGAKLCEAETLSQSRYFNQSLDIKYGQPYQAAVAAMVSDLPYDFILDLKSSDFNIIIEVVKGFLIV